MNTIHALGGSPSEPSRPRRSCWLVVGVVLLSLCLCAGISAVGFPMVMGEKGDVEAAIDGFMLAASRDDLDGAYRQFSARGRLNAPRDAFQEFFSHKANKVVVNGYEKCQVEAITIGYYAYADSNAPQGQVAEVSGTVGYQGGYSGTFQAVLEREGSEWRIFNINVTVPPQKFEDDLKKE